MRVLCSFSRSLFYCIYEMPIRVFSSRAREVSSTTKHETSSMINAGRMRGARFAICQRIARVGFYDASAIKSTPRIVKTGEASAICRKGVGDHAGAGVDFNKVSRSGDGQPSGRHKSRHQSAKSPAWPVKFSSAGWWEDFRPSWEGPCRREICKSARDGKSARTSSPQHSKTLRKWM